MSEIETAYAIFTTPTLNGRPCVSHYHRGRTAAYSVLRTRPNKPKNKVCFCSEHVLPAFPRIRTVVLYNEFFPPHGFKTVFVV